MALDNAQDIKTKKKASKKSEKVIDSVSTADSNVVNCSEVKEKKKKSRAKEQQLEPEIVTTQLEDPVLPVSDKKRKKRKRNTETEEKEPNVQEEIPAPPQKKHKNRTEFADPRVDETLSGQSRKGLEYAFLQMNKPTKWKFNKARQNWLVRNVWSSENIPELYMPLVCKYLADVQGGSREKLKMTCASVLNPEEPKPEEEEASKQTSDENKKAEPTAPVETSLSKRKVSFGSLIPASTPVSSAPTTDSAEVPEVPPPNADAEKLAIINRARAQMILDVLQ